MEYILYMLFFVMLYMGLWENVLCIVKYLLCVLCVRYACDVYYMLWHPMLHVMCSNMQCVSWHENVCWSEYVY